MNAIWNDSMGRWLAGSSPTRPDQPYGAIVATALREGSKRREGPPQMMARAVRAVLDVETGMSVGAAYHLVRQFCQD